MNSITAPGVSDLWMVSPLFYRSAQPDVTAIPAIAGQLAIETILDLRAAGEHDALAEQWACSAVGVRYSAVPMDAVEPPSQVQVGAALALLAEPERTLVHCAHGEDRTGVVCACWQLAHGIDWETVLQDFWNGHTRGIWGEYWMLGSVYEFSKRLKRGAAA